MEALNWFVIPFGVVMLSAMASTSSLAQAPASESPPQLVYLDSSEGALRLTKSESNGDFFRLVRYFNPQKNLAYCGVSSSIMVLNALPVPKPQGGAHGTYPFYTQENFFTPAATAIKKAEKVAEEGLSLTELADILNAHAGVEATKVFASETTLEAFKELTVAQLNSASSYVLVNYLRKALGQERGGHISPLAAYHRASDSFLILDVSQYKYPPVWAPAQKLFQAMAVKDDDSHLSRGFVLVKAVPAPPKSQ